MSLVPARRTRALRSPPPDYALVGVRRYDLRPRIHLRMPGGFERVASATPSISSEGTIRLVQEHPPRHLQIRDALEVVREATPSVSSEGTVRLAPEGSISLEPHPERDVTPPPAYQMPPAYRSPSPPAPVPAPIIIEAPHAASIEPAPAPARPTGRNVPGSGRWGVPSSITYYSTISGSSANSNHGDEGDEGDAGERDDATSDATSDAGEDERRVRPRLASPEQDEEQIGLLDEVVPLANGILDNSLLPTNVAAFIRIKYMRAIHYDAFLKLRRRSLINLNAAQLDDLAQRLLVKIQAQPPLPTHLAIYHGTHFYERTVDWAFQPWTQFMCVRFIKRLAAVELCGIEWRRHDLTDEALWIGHVLCLSLAFLEHGKTSGWSLNNLRDVLRILVQSAEVEQDVAEHMLSDHARPLRLLAQIVGDQRLLDRPL